MGDVVDVTMKWMGDDKQRGEKEKRRGRRR
jgi:hypothetical protein